MTWLSSLLQSYFGLWVLLCALLACTLPISLHAVLPVIPALLGLVMLGIGLTLRVDDFSALSQKPGLILAAIAVKFTVMPLLGYALACLLHLPPEWAVGLILVSCCPGGTASNLMTFLAGGDVALTVTLTSLTTLIAPIATPWLLFLFAQQWLTIAPEKLFLSILQIVILPVVLGITIRRFLPVFCEKALPWLPMISILLILLIIATVMNANAPAMHQAHWGVYLAVILLNVGGLLAGYGFGKLLGVSAAQRIALTFEMGMQDSGLGVTLAMIHLGPLYALPSALYSVWQNISGPLLTAPLARQMRAHQTQIQQNRIQNNEPLRHAGNLKA